MSQNYDWLPPLVLLENHDGNWEKYLEVIYAFYKQDFVEEKPVYLGRELAVKRHPMVDGKEATFWHIISEGKKESERLPNMRRCERIRWSRPIIEHVDEPKIKIWENQRRGETRILIWFEEKEYLIVLAERKSYLLFWTAYPVTNQHTKRKLQKEYEAFKKAGVA